MSVKLNKRASRKPHRRKAIDRPFDPQILDDARQIAARYRIVLQPQDDGGYLGYCLEMPLVMGDGVDADECVATTRDAIVGVVAYMLEQGEIPPAAADDERRDQQVNVRLTIQEKVILEEAARQEGYRGVSDFVRSKTFAALAKSA